MQNFQRIYCINLYNDRKNMLRLTTDFPFATSETGHDY